MDVWIFAAAAGAGYVAQQLRHLNIGNRNWPNFSYDVLKSGRAGSPAFIQKAFDKDSQFQKERMKRYKELHSDDSSAEERASVSGNGGEDTATLDEVCDSDSPHGLENDIVFSKGILQDADEVMVPSGSSCHPSIIEIGYLFGSKQVKCSLRCKGVNREYVNPQTSLEILSQLWNTDPRIDENACSAHAAWCAFVHASPVSGCRILSRPHSGWCCETSGSGSNNMLDKIFMNPTKIALGIPKLPDVALKKSLFATRNKRNQVLARSNASELVPGDLEKAEVSLSAGSSNELVLLYLGFTLGVICTSSVSLWEMEKLRKSLRHTQNLVQDLHDELEMKDSLTVRELATENNQLLDSSNVCIQDNFPSILREEECHQGEEEESFKKIEAELQAEWDRLQSNVNLFQLENNLTDSGELSPGSLPDIAQGELKSECFSRRADSPCYPERYRSGVPTPGCSQYPVCPRLLSVKLHEVIQSRLEDRIKQLETALGNMMKGQESEYMLPDSLKAPDYQTVSASSSPEGLQSIEQSVVIHLPGEAPAPYYEDIPTHFSESDKEERGNHEAMSAQEKQQVGLEKLDGINAHPEQHIVLTDDCISWNDSENGDDEMERLLIQQIVERARQGSPAVLKAKWALLSTDTAGSFYHQEADDEVAETAMEEADSSSGMGTQWSKA